MKTFTIGDVVFYVPSHDQEYKHKPNLGVVVDVFDSSVKVQDESTSLFLSAPFEYVAHVGSAQETLDLICHLNNKWLELQHLLYRVELAVMNFAAGSVLIPLIKSIKHYHIN